MQHATESITRPHSTHAVNNTCQLPCLHGGLPIPCKCKFPATIPSQHISTLVPFPLPNSPTTPTTRLTGSEHAADVGVPLVEALVHDGADEGRAVEEDALAGLVAVLFGHLLPPVNVALPEPAVLHLLDLSSGGQGIRSYNGVVVARTIAACAVL